MSEVRHVVLVKPGDILVFGNVGAVDLEVMADAVQRLRQELDLKVVVFEADIDMAAVPGGDT